MLKIKLAGSFTLVSILAYCSVMAQTVQPGTQTDGKRSNSIQTAVPFLMIAPDARAGAMGDVGAATSPDAYASHWNPAKLAYVGDRTGLSVSYSPWLRRLIPDIDLGYLTAYHHIDERNTIAGSLRYFSLGTIQLTDASQNDLGTYSPNEFAIDGTYARKFGETFSLGTSFRYIRSSLSNGQFAAGQDQRPSNAFAADVSGYYREDTRMFGSDAEFAMGVNISNIGTKMSYVDGGQKFFLPTNMKIGAATTLKMDDMSTLTFALDLNKLLVPTSPIRDTNGNILAGKDPDRSVPAGIFGSFSDAPGGFSEEMHEISYSFGSEYKYSDLFAVRAGYFYEHPTKGDRQYLTLGAGFRYNIINFDIAYLLANQQKTPMANTLRFSLSCNLQRTKKTTSDVITN